MAKGRWGAKGGGGGKDRTRLSFGISLHQRRNAHEF